MLQHLTKKCSSWVVSGSRRLATNSKVYELRIYSTHNPVALKKALEFSAKALPIRFSVSPALGYFISEIGALNETVHIWEYDGYQHRANVRKTLAADKSWGEKAAPMLELFTKQENLTMRLFPWSSVVADVKPGGVYFLQNYTFNSDVSDSDMSKGLQSFIRDSDLTCLGAWREELGPNSGSNAYAVFHAENLDSAKNPALTPADVSENLRQITSKVHTRLLTPAAFSDWK